MSKASPPSSEAARLREGETYVYGDGDGEAEVSGPSLIPRRPSRVGRYVVLEAIGAGGMGEVWAAYDPKLDRKVALKMLRTRFGTTREQLEINKERLLREAKALAQLSHPNIVTVHDVDTWNGDLFMAMEFVDGPTLGEWVAATRPSWRSILRRYEDAGRGLAAAHARSIIHRDFKPSNVIMGRDGRVRVLDFGLAKTPVTEAGDAVSRSNETSEDDDGLTQAGRILGTPAYMAPEQIAATGPVGPATDQFCFAVSLYESLYGGLPFLGRRRKERYTAIHARAVREPPKDSQVPYRVFRVVKRALDPDPAQRFPSMDALLAALMREPYRRLRQIGSIAALVVLAASATAATMAYTIPADEETCQGASERWSEVWSPAKEAALRQGLIATEVSYADDTATRVAAGFAAYGERWVDERTLVCRATRVHHEQSEALLDVRIDCLDRRLSEVEALVRVLSDPDTEVLERAVAAVYRLQRPESCQHVRVDPAESMPTSATERHRVIALRRQLDRAAALLMAGRYADAVIIAASARDQAERIDHPATLAHARLAEGRALRFAGESQAARRALEQAVAAAAENGLDTLEAQAWLNLVYLAGIDLGDTTTADAWRLPARAALQREGDSPELRLALRLNEGAVDLKAHRFEAAAAANHEVIELGRMLGTPQSPNVAMAWMNLGVIAAQRNLRDEAEQAFQRVFDLNRELLGPRHPAVADAALNLGNALLRNGRYTRAEALTQEALRIREQAYGPSARVVAEARNTLAVLYIQNEQWERAAALLRKSLDDLQGQPSTVLEAMLLNNLGAVATGRNEAEEAARLHGEALAVLQKIHGDAEQGRLPIARTQMRLCQVAPKVADPEALMAACNDALAVLGPVYDTPPDDVAAMHEARARVLEGVGDYEGARRDRAAARQIRDGRRD